MTEREMMIERAAIAADEDFARMKREIEERVLNRAARLLEHNTKELAIAAATGTREFKWATYHLAEKIRNLKGD